MGHLAKDCVAEREDAATFRKVLHQEETSGTRQDDMEAVINK